MNPWDKAGFGYSREDRLAAWNKLEDGPEAGPECPLTFDLLELARGRLDDARQIASLREHLDRCPRCGQRFDAQSRAVQQLKAGYATEVPSGGAPMSPQKVWQASVEPVSLMALDGPDAVTSMPIRLSPPGEKGTELSGVLRWNRGRAGGGVAPWYVALHLPRPEDARARDAWSDLANWEIELDLTDKNQERPCLLFLELGRKDDVLFSLPAAVSLDPPSVRTIRLKTGQRRPPTMYE